MAKKDKNNKTNKPEKAEKMSNDDRLMRELIAKEMMEKIQARVSQADPEVLKTIKSMLDDG